MQRTRGRTLPRGESTMTQTLGFARRPIGATELWLLFRFVNPLTMLLTLATCRR